MLTVFIILRMVYYGNYYQKANEMYGEYALILRLGGTLDITNMHPYELAKTLLDGGFMDRLVSFEQPVLGFTTRPITLKLHGLTQRIDKNHLLSVSELCRLCMRDKAHPGRIYFTTWSP